MAVIVNFGRFYDSSQSHNNNDTHLNIFITVVR